VIATDLNKALLNGENSFNVDFKRLSFYLKNTWIIKLLHLLHLTYILRLEVASCNIRLRQRSEMFKKLLEALETSTLRTEDFNTQIKVINEQIDTLSFIQAEAEKVLLFKRHKMLGDFETSHRLVTEMLETFYRILRMYKKANKKEPSKTSQLAKDTSAHSIATHSKIINGN